MAKRKTRRRREEVAIRMWRRMSDACYHARIPVSEIGVDPVARIFEVRFISSGWMNVALEGRSPRALIRECLRYLRGEL